jgi:hypothetical protein
LILETLAALISWAASVGPVCSFNFPFDAPVSDAAPADPDPVPVAPLILPRPNPRAAATIAPPERRKVNWTGLIKSELRFLTVEHLFRVATEPGTRADGFGWGRGYRNSVFNLHGWADGDPFYVNYIGHPMQGAVVGYIWQQNDPGFRAAEFGRGHKYWKSKLRGMATAFVHSEQFEIGPFSEASVGHIQKLYPQQGFVDHAVTPVLGLAWTVAEDALDRYLIQGLENRIRNVWVRMALRTSLNPSRTFANTMGLLAPWHRDSRAGIRSYLPDRAESQSRRAQSRAEPTPGRATSTFEFALNSRLQRFVGARPGPRCIGGDASGSFRVAPEWMLVAEVGGCKLLTAEPNLSGDSLSYLLGPRWTPAPAGRWSPYVEVLVGGNKITHEQLLPEKKRALELLAAQNGAAAPAHEDYTIADESNGFAVAAGTGLDLKLSAALVFRVASVEYSHSYVTANRGLNYANGVQVRTGMVLRVGTW